MEATLLLLPHAYPEVTNSSNVQANAGAIRKPRCSSLAQHNLGIPSPLPALPTPTSRITAPGHVGLAGFRGGRVERCQALAASGTEVQLSPVKGVLFDMDGVLCDSEEPSRDAAVALFAELGVSVMAVDFIPFMGTGEANFLGGVARKYSVAGFDPVEAKKRFFEIYIEKYVRPNSGLGYPGALDLIIQCKKAGLKLAVASSADRIKVDANLAAAGLPQTNFDAVVSADLFKNLKPAPDIFLAAAKALGLPPQECVVIEDALVGVQAARSAGMRCIAVTTTLDREKLIPGGPSLIRRDISCITLGDILTLNGKDPMTLPEPKSEEEEEVGFFDRLGFFTTQQLNVDFDKELPLPLGYLTRYLTPWRVLGAMVILDILYLTTRRDVFKLTSFALGLSSLGFAATHWKAMSYASPKAILNAIVGVSRPDIARGSELTSGERVQQFKKYIADIEAKGGGQLVADFQPKLEWLNSPPLRLNSDLRGKLVLLDFWTYCCINCMHILPDLAYLEKKFKDQPFTVVGVHSAKFDNEKDLSAIRNAVLRYDVAHPVVNDGDMTMWRQLGVSSWPTLALVSPKGRLLAMLAGEGHRKDVDDLIQAALQYYGEKGILNSSPVPESLEKNKDTRLVASPLKFPGKLAADLANQRLFISDSNNHRIVVTDLEGNFIMQVGGGGGEGLRDGSFEYAAFNRPQGITYNPSKNVLYVADTENHAVREIDFVNDTVRTLAGNGEKGSDYKGGRKGSSQVLNSPWDVCLDSSSRVLYIAMAGQHQIWQLDLSQGVAKVFSGDGYERNLNGKTGSDTSYAQPSGLSLGPDSKELLIADSESSSVRAMDLRTGGCQLLAGGDPMFADNLFQFGDEDGIGSKAKLQHPLGVLYGGDGLVYITDSYNHKVKVMDEGSRKVKTLAGTGKAGFKDGPALSAQLSEPAGLTQGPNGKIYVADTNNSLIRVLSLGSNPTLETLELKGVPPPPPAPASAPRRLRRRISSDTEVVRVDSISSASGDLQLQITLPSGFHFTTEATSKFEADVESDGSVSVEPVNGTIGPDGRARLHFSRADNSSTGSVRISCKVYYCQLDEVCLYKAVAFEVPFTALQTNSSQLITIPYLVQPKTSTKNTLASV